MARNTNQTLVKGRNAKDILYRLKEEVADEIGVEFTEYNGDLTARECGSVGGGMVKRMIQYAEQNMR